MVDDTHIYIKPCIIMNIFSLNIKIQLIYQMNVIFFCKNSLILAIYHFDRALKEDKEYLIGLKFIKKILR